MGHLGLPAWLCSLPAPAHLLIRWIWETGKSPWFLRNNWKHRCIINILLILNPKHSNYWEENQFPSRLKPGHLAYVRKPTYGSCGAGVLGCLRQHTIIVASWFLLFLSVFINSNFQNVAKSFLQKGIIKVSKHTVKITLRAHLFYSFFTSGCLTKTAFLTN